MTNTKTISIKLNLGVVLGGLSFLLFLSLKLCGVIAWSWWWVTAPLWGPPVLVTVIGMTCLIVVVSLKALGSLSAAAMKGW